MLAKILVSPIRLAVGWGISPRILGGLAMVMLVLLRMTIGWHFFSEGIDKYRAGGWSATPFFANARGPLAGEFRALVWDQDGDLRLNQENTLRTWATYRDRIGDHYAFTDAQRLAAQVNYAEAVRLYQELLKANKNDLQEYQLGRERIEKLDEDPVRNGVDSLGGQRETIRKEWMQKLAPTVNEIDLIWTHYEASQQRLPTDEQKRGERPYPLLLPQTTVMNTSMIDQVVPYFDMTIGWCLILGFFTPVAALAAAGFLASVFLSQYPPVTGPGSSNYQLIEGMACLVLAATGAGRFAGLDFFLHLIVRKVVGSPRGQE